MGLVTPRPAPVLPPSLLDVLASIPRGRHLTGEARRRAVTAVGVAYHDHGLSMAQVAALTHRSFGGTRRLLIEAGVPIRRAGAPRRPATQPERTPR